MASFMEAKEVEALKNLPTAAAAITLRRDNTPIIRVCKLATRFYPSRFSTVSSNLFVVINLSGKPDGYHWLDR